jgi:hypothetical protein
MSWWLCSLAEQCRLEAKSEKEKSGAKSVDALTGFVNTGGTNVKIAKNVAIMVPWLWFFHKAERMKLCREESPVNPKRNNR